MSVRPLNPDDPTDDRQVVRVYNPHGREIRKIIHGKRAAKSYETKMENEVRVNRGFDPNAGKITFREYALQVIESRDLTPTTRFKYRSDCERLLFPVWGSRAIGSLNYTDAVRLSTAVKSATTPVTATGALVLARSIMKAAVLDHVAEQGNPFLGLPLAVGKARSRRTPTFADVHATIDRCNDSDYQQTTAGIIGTYSGTGVRVAELLGLDRLKDIDWRRGTITIPRQLQHITAARARVAGYTKSGFYLSPAKTPAGRDRVVPVPAWVIDILSALASLHPGDPVTLPWKDPDSATTATFTPLITPYAPQAISVRLRDATRRAGVGFSPKDLRHLYATTLEQGGIPLRTIMQVMGHEPQGVTMSVYVDVTDATLRAIRGVMQAAWESPGEQAIAL